MPPPPPTHTTYAIYGSNLLTVKDLDCKWATFDLKGNLPQLDLISMSFCHFFIFAISLSVLRSIMASGYYPFGIFNFSDFSGFTRQIQNSIAPKTRNINTNSLTV